MLGLIPTVIFVLVIVLNEFYIFKSNTNSHMNSTARNKWKQFLWQIYFQFIPLGFAIVASQFITHISKYTIGRLRPHFIDVCQPQIESTGEIITRLSNCTDSISYHINYKCTRPEKFLYQMTDSHLSFMSGHSSHMAVSMIYLIIYLEARFCWKDFQRGKQALQTALFSFAFWVALSRISDYKHHWSDVLVGFIQGTVFAIFTALYGSDLFSDKSQNGNYNRDKARSKLSPQAESAISINMNV